MANERLRTASFGPGFLWAIVLFCSFAFVAWCLFRFAAPSPTYEEKRAQARRDKVAAINIEAQDKLYGPAKWIDKTKGTVQLPIDTAMDLVVNDYQSKAVGPSQVKVDNPYPYGLQMATAAAPSTTATSSTTSTSSTPVAASPAPAAPATPSPEVKK